jgi:hypothetical protein
MRVGWAVQSRLKWTLAVCAIVIAVGGTVLLWYLHHDVSTSHLWKNFAPSVLQYAIPPVIALFGWIAQQIITSRPGQSTPKQLRKARRALVGRGLEWWRGIPPPAWPGRVLRSGLNPLEIVWAGTTADGQRTSGSTSDVEDLAERFRAPRPFRLVIRGPSGSGKSIFARLLMAELLKDIAAGQPVPVFLPAWSWDPGAEQMNDWIKRRIVEDYPELGGGASYGPTAVTNLVDQGMILPVLDGLDSLPRELRKQILRDGGLTSQDRLIVTCRGDEFDAVKSFVVLTPETLDAGNATGFLSAVTVQPKEDWDRAGQNNADIAAILADSRLTLMAGAICGKAGYDPERFAGALAKAGGGTAEGRLVDLLIPTLISGRGERKREYPDYDPGLASSWLELLAPLGLRESIDLLDVRWPEPSGQDHQDYPGVSCIAWWNLYRGVRRLRERQAGLRAAAGGLVTFLVTYGVFQSFRPFHYALLTAGSYGAMVFFGCLFLGGDRAAPVPDAGKQGPAGERPGRLALARRIGEAWTGLHPYVKVVAAITVSAGGLLWWRIGEWYAGPWVGFRAGLTDGLNDGLIVVILFVIARVPGPPRGLWSTTGRPAIRSQARTFALALILGIPFGLAWGLSEEWKGQHHSPPPLIPGQLVLTGLITGVDFAMGAWLFGWSETWSRSGRAPNPRSAARADLASALYRPLILAFTFAFAFGISTPFNFTGVDVWAWFVVGLALGSLGNEWPLYAAALIVLRGGRKHRLPVRLMRFLDCCRDRGLLRSVGQAYQIQDDGLLWPLNLPPGQRGAGAAAHPAGQGGRPDDQAPDSELLAI